MSDRYKGFVVTLDRDVKDEDAEDIITAISMIRGVIDAKPVMAGIDDHMNRARIKRELQHELAELLK